MFSFSGLASGLDTQAIIEQLVAIESRPINRLEQRRSEYVSSQSRFSEYRTKLTSLEDVVKKLKDVTQLPLFKATSSDEDRVRVSASDEAADASYQVTVNNVAKAHSIGFTSPFSDPEQAFGGGQIGINVGGYELTPITIDAQDGLYDIRDKINQSGASVNASVIYDGTDYQLVITSEKTGVANGFEIQATGFPPGSALTASVLQNPEDASVTINNIAVTSASNTIENAIQGVSIELLGTTDAGSPVSVGVERDNDAVADVLEDFIDAYNGVFGLLDSESDKSDVALRTVRNTLRNAFGTILDDQTFGLVGLSQLGIETDGSGRAKLDREVFDQAFDGDLDQFLEVLGGKADGSAEGIADVFSRVLRGDPDTPGSVGLLTFGEGTLSLREKTVGERIRSIDDQITRLEDRLVKYEERQTAKFAALEQLVAQFQAQGAALNF
ncbi:MAG: flagellar filament capping protein FliD [Planctomycetota bacterium]